MQLILVAEKSKRFSVKGLSKWMYLLIPVNGCIIIVTIATILTIVTF